MLQKPFFSVVIPTLNEEKYLPVLLKSLSVQTFTDFEVIVVDGGSRDKTSAVFNKFGNKFSSSRFIVSDKANVGHQRNIGGKEAKGEYLVFLDADVDIDRTFLEEMHILALKKKFKMATTWIKPDSNKSFDKTLILIANLLNELAHGLNQPYTGGYNTIIKRDAFIFLKGFREDLKINEDMDFALFAYKKGINCILLKEPVVTFSLRRYRSKGTLPALAKIAHGNFYYFTKLYKLENHYKYPMGGDAHRIEKKKKPDLIKLKTYLTGIEKLGRKVWDFLGE